MIEITIQEQNIQALKKITNDPSVLNDILKEISYKLRLLAQGRSPIYTPQKGEKPLHPPGLLKDSWTIPEQSGPLLWTFQNPQEYATTLEEGTYPPKMVVATRRDQSPGRLMFFGSGVYSTRAKGGIVGPLLEDQKLQTEILNLVSQRLSEVLAGGM